MYRSFDGAAHWELLSFPNFDAIDLLVDQEDGTIYAAAYQGVWKSQDQGKSWTRISNRLPIESINPFTGDTLYAVTWSIAKIKQSNTLYAAVRDNGIYKSYDAGKNWFSVNSDLTSGLTFNTGVVVSQIDTNVVYIGGWTVRFQEKTAGFFRSLNSGQSWERYQIGLADVSPDRIDPISLTIDNSSNILYGSFCIEFDDSSKYAIYKLIPAPPTSVENINEDKNLPKDFWLFQPYPNPFNFSTIIDYQLRRENFINIKIYDITGHEVIQLVDQRQPAGDYQISWNGKDKQGGDAPSGIYFVKLKTRSFIQIRKMLLIR